MNTNNQWTVERALREGRADLLLCDGQDIVNLQCLSRDVLYGVDKRLEFNTKHHVVHHVVVDLEDGENVSRLTLRDNHPQPEPDGPPRDWPSIWRQQMREHIERAPMVPREYVQEVLTAIAFHAAAKGISKIISNARNDEVKP